MSAILSVFNRNGEAVDRGVVELMLADSAKRAVDGQDMWIDGSIALAHQHFWITPEELGERQPLVDASGGRTIAAYARLDNRSDLLKALGRDLDGNSLSDASLILLAYQRWGTACAERLRGDFAFVIWDGDEQHLFAARDVLGVFGLCYYLDEKRCLVGSEVGQLLVHPAVESRVNEGKIADYLAGFTHNQEESFYENIRYCPPAHCLLIRSESVRKWRYWDVDPQARIRYKDEREYADHFLELLTEAVRCRLRSVGPVGISMSGGLDSTMLAAVSSRLLPQMALPQERVKSFSYAFDELTSCDERRYIQPVVDRYQLDDNYILCDDQWTLRDGGDELANKGYLMSDPYPGLQLSVMKAAQLEGCRLLMVGYYGDTLYLGGRFWAAGMMADLRLGQLAKTMVEQQSSISLREDILIGGLRHMLPQRLRMVYGRYQRHRVTTVHPGIHPQLAESTRLARGLDADQGRRARFGLDQWHRYRSLTRNLSAQGASAVRSRYNQYGLELSTPYWDRRLMEYILAIPADQLGRPQRDRWILRNAASGLLPRSVRERRWKTTFLPLMDKGLLDKEQDKVQRIMTDPHIVQRQYVRAEWLRQHLDGGRGWSNRRHNYFLWKCLSLELWLSLLYSPRHSSIVV